MAPDRHRYLGEAGALAYCKEPYGKRRELFTRVVCGLSRSRRTRKEWNIQKNIFLCVHLHFAELNAHTSVRESSPKCD